MQEKKRNLELRLEILNANYWEMIKFEKDLSFILPPTHSKRIRLAKESNEILAELHKIQKEIDEEKGKV